MALSENAKWALGLGAAVVVLGVGYKVLSKSEPSAAASGGGGAQPPQPNPPPEPDKQEPPKPTPPAPPDPYRGFVWNGLLPKNGKWGIVGDDAARTMATMLAYAGTDEGRGGVYKPEAWRVPSPPAPGAPPSGGPFAATFFGNAPDVVAAMKDVDVVVVSFLDESLALLTSNDPASVSAAGSPAVAMTRLRDNVNGLVAALSAAYPQKKIVFMLPPWNALPASPYEGQAENVPAPFFGVSAANVEQVALTPDVAAFWVGPMLRLDFKEPNGQSRFLVSSGKPSEFLQGDDALDTLARLIHTEGQRLADMLYGDVSTPAPVSGVLEKNPAWLAPGAPSATAASKSTAASRSCRRRLRRCSWGRWRPRASGPSSVLPPASAGSCPRGSGRWRGARAT